MRQGIQNILQLIIAVSVIAASCTGRRGEAEHKGLIPEKDLILILTEVYIADGLLSLPEINYKYSVGDTLSSYIDIIENHGYTKPEMDRTMRFYFVKNPKKLINIYDKVLGKLSAMESLVDMELPGAGIKELNIWPGKSFYSYPDATAKDTTWFDFPISLKGTFNLQFTITIFHDDQTVDPRNGLFFSHTDSAGIEKRLYFSTISYLKDGLPHTYNIRLVQNLPDPVRLKGGFIDLEGMKPFSEMNFIVGNITLTRNMSE